MKRTLRALLSRVSPMGMWLWWISLAAVVFLSITPGLGPPERFGLDKAAHFSAYGWLSLLTTLTLRGRAARWAGALLVCTALGTEVFQVMIDGRTAMVADAVANLAGLVIGTFTGTVVSRSLEGKPQPPAE